MRIRRNRRVSWRSHRRVRQVLLAFATAGGALGVLLLILFVHCRQPVLLVLGLVYVMLAGMLFAIRAILEHLDDLHRRQRHRRVGMDGEAVWR